MKMYAFFTNDGDSPLRCIVADTQEHASAHARMRGWGELEEPQKPFELKGDKEALKLFTEVDEVRAILCPCHGKPLFATVVDDEALVVMDKDATLIELATAQLMMELNDAIHMLH